jgi:hypothetical protein
MLRWVLAAVLMLTMVFGGISLTSVNAGVGKSNASEVVAGKKKAKKKKKKKKKPANLIKKKAAKKAAKSAV